MVEPKYKFNLFFINRLLILGTFTCLMSQVFLSRGLGLDGVHTLYKITFEQSFYFIETARMLTHLFQQLPSLLFIKFSSSNSIGLLTQVFSFGLIWIHILSFIICYLILPQSKKEMIFFPLFAFFIGPVTGLGASIGASLSVFSYIWLIAFLIHYSNLDKKSHKLLLLLAPIPLLLSHEMMSYMAWPLIFLSLLKLKTENLILRRCLIQFTIIVLFISSLLSIFFIIFPKNSEVLNKTIFFKTLFDLNFFIKIKNNSIDWIQPSCLIAFFLLSMLFLNSFKYRHFFNKILLITCFIFLTSFSLIAIIQPFYNMFGILKLTEEEEARVWISCIALPVSWLLWWFYENQKIKFKPVFFKACVIAVFSLSIWRVGSDYQFYQFQKLFSQHISNCKGIINWKQTVKNQDLNKLSKKFKYFNLDWKLMSSSLIYPRQSNINTIIRSKNRFTGCYLNPPYGMCENNIIIINNKFFNFNKIRDYDKNNISICD